MHDCSDRIAVGQHGDAARLTHPTRAGGGQSFARPQLWAVCLKDSGTLIGNMYRAKQDFDTWELGYVFNADFHGKGYAAETVRFLVMESVRHEQARRIVALSQCVTP
ncbi:MAG: GNAT family N-acetyltransferase [Cellulomonadaceae bacterium]|jgi:RimJ/RimL family protein N-acetyltransferase|nr:GNAT family N-acetyltransferase [Cellulomonadaceae bacterium]